MENKLIKTKENIIKKLHKQIEEIKKRTIYKKKEQKILMELRKLKSKTRISKKSVSHKSPSKIKQGQMANGISPLTKIALYGGTSLATALALYKIYRIFNDKPKQETPVPE